MSEQVQLTLQPSGAAEITIHRPERHNAMTQAMYESLLERIAECGANPKVRAVVFRGAGGKSFISGTDIAHFAEFRQGEQGVAYEAFVEQVVGSVERIAVPTIAVIDGWAVGGGLALATVCDFRICSNGARFGVPIAKTLSNTLSSRNLARLQAAFGAPRVKRMLLLAEYIDAAEALSCGYVYETCTTEQLGERADALAERLIGLSAVTQAAVKESLRRILVEQSLEDDDLVHRVYGSEAFRQGVAGFLKR
ncbi:enoyl-CoA hydratase [Comamonas endophytica]|uniref:Enoyl-CoA hydratase n=1 Tax=Comamonas endophytica TaxID=2949090 RepID=A0ABY6G995_9BURK|nr:MULTISPECIES: enoyl-CoA hydratase [unclassified Acidovorax]MCD2511893.1 enoyl-CoA hydratase [Acidovorax sp. D4N7]UYG51612.1 enoyl-CoA hydratase [Acidovorax sp. 5MLIR]